MDEQATDLIWDAIVDSAKTRFDYKSYANTFDMFENENVAENILFSIIVGYAEGLSDNEIKAKINRELLPFALSFEENDLDELLLDKRKIFAKEIHATTTAVSLLQQGADVTQVLFLIKSVDLSE